MLAPCLRAGAETGRQARFNAEEERAQAALAASLGFTRSRKSLEGLK
jgi:hypothetical protein